MADQLLCIPARLAGLGALLLLTGALLLPGSAAAQTKHCQPVVKKIYSIYEGPPFYKAKVFIVHGSRVTCAEARKIIWRSFQPGGFNGTIRGWECKSNFGGSWEREKCIREFPDREVIKSGPAKPCPSCHANRN